MPDLNLTCGEMWTVILDQPINETSGTIFSIISLLFCLVFISALMLFVDVRSSNEEAETGSSKP